MPQWEFSIGVLVDISQILAQKPVPGNLGSTIVLYQMEQVDDITAS
jgi:hypothetical protein